MLDDVEFDDLMAVLVAVAEFEEELLAHPEPDDPLHPPIVEP